LPPLHERARDTCGGCSAGSVLTLCVRDRRCRNWIVSPLMKNLRVCGGREARRRLPHEPPFLRGLAFVRHRAVDLAHPRWAGHRSCGTAPDSHRTSPSLHRPGICARPPEHTPPPGLRLSVEVGPSGTSLLVRHINASTNQVARGVKRHRCRHLAELRQARSYLLRVCGSSGGLVVAGSVAGARLGANPHLLRAQALALAGWRVGGKPPRSTRLSPRPGTPGTKPRRRSRRTRYFRSWLGAGSKSE
jgi:hypothetical protein